MEETVPTIHTAMVQCNIFFMTENDEGFHKARQRGQDLRRAPPALP